MSRNWNPDKASASTTRDESESATNQVAAIIARVDANTAAKREFARFFGWCLPRARQSYADARVERPERPSETLREVQRFWRCAQKLENIYNEMGPAGRRLIEFACGGKGSWPKCWDNSSHADAEASVRGFLAPFQLELEVRQSPGHRAVEPGHQHIATVSAEDKKQIYDRNMIATWADGFSKILGLNPRYSVGSDFLETAAEYLELLEPGRSNNLFEKALDSKRPGRPNLLGFFVEDES